MTKTYYPINGRITLYSYNHHSKPLRITATALTNLDGEIRIADFFINDINKARRVVRRVNGVQKTRVSLAIVRDGDPVPDFKSYWCEIKETELPRPGRSFRWNEFARCWIHDKTGVRVVNA